MTSTSLEIHYKPSLVYGDGHYDILRTPMTLYTNTSAEVLIPAPPFLEQLIRTKQIKMYNDTMYGGNYIELDDLNEICANLLNKYNEYVKLSARNGLLDVINEKLDKVIENQCSNKQTTHVANEDKKKDITDYESLSREVLEEYDDIHFFMSSIIGYVRYGYFMTQLTETEKPFYVIGADGIRLYFIEKEIGGIA